MRIYTGIFIIIGIQMLLYMGGMQSLPSGYVINGLGPFNPEGFQASEFFSSIFGILLISIAGGAIVGYLFRANPESYIVGGFAGTILMLFVGDLIGIITFYNTNYPGFEWMGLVISGLLFPVAATFALSLISWWRGASD